tara:strand:+ start:224 stop:847 length:624 start_codon:yes stop_codon:yes gene_type:complete
MSKTSLFIVIITTLLSFTLTAKSEEIFFGADIGIGILNVGAKENAKKISDLSGSTVSTDYDTGEGVARFYTGYKLNETIILELGYFNTGDVKARYTLSGNTANERYEASGFDTSIVYSFDASEKLGQKTNIDVFFKAGLHFSTLDGNENIIIGGTSYATKATDSGTGYLIGAGYDYDDKNRIGVSFYRALGGQSKNNLSFIYYGYKF